MLLHRLLSAVRDDDAKRLALLLPHASEGELEHACVYEYLTTTRRKSLMKRRIYRNSIKNYCSFK